MAEKTEEVLYDDNKNGGDEDEEMKKEEEEEEENDENSTSLRVEDAASSLLELNLLMIISSLTLSTQELSEIEDMGVKEQDVKTFVSKLRGRKRVIDEPKGPDRRGGGGGGTRLQPKILDSRHGRKM